MPDFNGKLVAQDLRRLSKNRFKLVFVSDYYDEVFSTFQYDIESFIPKNRLDEFLEEELLRIIDMIKSNERVSFSFKYSLKNRSVNGQVYLDEILYIESMNGEIFLHTQDKQYKLLNYKFEKSNLNLLNTVLSIFIGLALLMFHAYQLYYRIA